MSFSPLPFIKPHFHDDDGALATGYVIVAYDSSTQDPVALYRDHAGSSVYPIIGVVMNSRGEPEGEGIYLDDSLTYKIEFRQPTVNGTQGAVIWTVNGVRGSGGSGGGTSPVILPADTVYGNNTDIAGEATAVPLADDLSTADDTDVPYVGAINTALEGYLPNSGDNTYTGNITVDGNGNITGDLTVGGTIDASDITINGQPIDQKNVKVSDNDTTPAFLEDKIIVGGDLVKTIENEGGDEAIRLSVTLPEPTVNTDEKVKVNVTDPTASWLFDKLSDGAGISFDIVSGGPNGDVIEISSEAFNSAEAQALGVYTQGGGAGAFPVSFYPASYTCNKLTSATWTDTTARLDVTEAGVWHIYYTTYTSTASTSLNAYLAIRHYDSGDNLIAQVNSQITGSTLDYETSRTTVVEGVFDLAVNDYIQVGIVMNQGSLTYSYQQLVALENANALAIGVNGSGTENYIPKWSDENTLTDSAMQDDGSTITVESRDVNVTNEAGYEVVLDKDSPSIRASRNWGSSGQEYTYIDYDGIGMYSDLGGGLYRAINMDNNGTQRLYMIDEDGNTVNISASEVVINPNGSDALYHADSEAGVGTSVYVAGSSGTLTNTIYDMAASDGDNTSYWARTGGTITPQTVYIRQSETEAVVELQNMALNFLDADNNSLTLPRYASEPAAPPYGDGALYYNTTTDLIYVYANGAWSPIVVGGSAVTGTGDYPAMTRWTGPNTLGEASLKDDGFDNIYNGTNTFTTSYDNTVLNGGNTSFSNSSGNVVNGANTLVSSQYNQVYGDNNTLDNANQQSLLGNDNSVTNSPEGVTIGYDQVITGSGGKGIIIGNRNEGPSLTEQILVGQNNTNTYGGSGVIVGTENENLNVQGYATAVVNNCTTDATFIGGNRVYIGADLDMSTIPSGKGIVIGTGDRYGVGASWTQIIGRVRDNNNVVATEGQVLKADVDGKLTWGDTAITGSGTTPHIARFVDGEEVGDSAYNSDDNDNFYRDGNTISATGSGNNVVGSANTVVGNSNVNSIVGTDNIINETAGGPVSENVIAGELNTITDGSSNAIIGHQQASTSNSTVTSVGNYNTVDDTNNAVVVGQAIDMDAATGVVAIGANLTVDNTNSEVVIGTDSDITQIKGKIRDHSGDLGTLGQALTADASGNLTWATGSGGDSQDILDLTSGIIMEPQTITLVEDGGSWYAEMEAVGGGDLTVNLAGTKYTLDCTTGSGTSGKARSTTALTLGSATVPAIQYIVIKLNGSTPEVRVGSTIDRTSAFAMAGVYELLDSTYTTANGALYYQRFNDSSNHPDEYRGMVSETAERVRVLGPQIFRGVEASTIITTNASALDGLHINTSAGIVYQLHQQTVTAETPVTEYIVVNHPTTPYTVVNNLNELTVNALGDPLYTNGKYFGMTFAIAVSSEGQGMRVYVWLPTGNYADQDNAINDLYGYADISAAIEQQSSITRLARIVIGYTNVNGGTFTNALGGVLAQDQRNYPIGTTGGGGVGGTDYTKYPYIPQTTPPSPVVEGTTYYNGNTHNLVVQVNGVNLDVGRENWIRGYNGTGITINEGQPVYVSQGTTEGSEYVAQIAPANAGSKLTCTFVGIATQDILNGEYGEVTVGGIVHDMDTSSWSNGDILYVSTVSGTLTNIAPAFPNYECKVGRVLNSSATEGAVFVAPDVDPPQGSGGIVQAGIQTFPIAQITDIYSNNLGSSNALYMSTLVIPTANIEVNYMSCFVIQTGDNHGTRMGIYSPGSSDTLLGQTVYKDSTSEFVTGINTLAMESSVSLMANTPYLLALQSSSNGTQFGYQANAGITTNRPNHIAAYDGFNPANPSTSMESPSSRTQTDNRIWLSAS